jgi:hypothetical protein
MHRRSKTLLAALIAAICGLTVVGAVAVSALKDDSDHENCAGMPQRHAIGAGSVPGGGRWSVTGDVRANGGCSDWLFGVSFVPFGTGPGSWRGAWDIPAGGHLSDRFTISAEDEASKSQRAFSGIVGARVQEIELDLGPGRRTVVVRPGLPSSEARRKFPWLRNFRFFVRFLPASSPIRVAKLIGSKGEVIASERPFEGVFEGPF